ncbi:MAG: 3-dehydroquinate synthase [Opitutaceae bacterium]|nr:3-dehydroquinate synthase [Opitutaceae bacterium]
MVDEYVVKLGERSYPIFFGEGLSTAIGARREELKSAGRNVVAVLDATVAEEQREAVGAMTGDTPRLLVSPGETSKSLANLGRILDFMAAHRLDRSSVLIAIGGGVIGDLAGFAAASFLRGIPFWQVPTTLLAMVDSSVGGKTGINLSAGKNLVGAFHQPATVFVSTDMLGTLPAREFAAGTAEVIKCGLLGDPGLLERLEKSPLSPRSSDLADVIRRCCEAKARVVEADEFERAAQGGRALLNLGHTFGHAIEQATAYGSYLHGEAVAIGLAAAARLSLKLGYLSPADVARVESLVLSHGLPVRLRDPISLSVLTEAMARDKKVRAGRLRFVVLKKLGEAVTQGDVDPGLASSAFREVGAVA